MSLSPFRLVGRAIAALAAAVIAAAVFIVPAHAAAQYRFVHLLKSQRSSILVFDDWRCKNGRGSDFVPRAGAAQIDVRSVWVPRGYSLWDMTKGGKIGIKLSSNKSYSHCFTFSGWPGNTSYVALAKGRTFKAGD